MIEKVVSSDVLRASEIQQFCEEREITTLFHFTRIENLHSILQNGLLSRDTLDMRKQQFGQQFLFNDPDRFDGHKDAICLSISFPNYQMFYNYRDNTEGINDSQWIVLLLDAKILWELNCAFCQRNAASRAISNISLADRRKPEALKGMFEDFYNIKHQNLLIPQNYPTHPQAEVLVFDPIPTQYIKAIHFWEEDALNQWLPNRTRTDYKTFRNRQYFRPRSDFAVWRPENFNSAGTPLSYTLRSK